MKKWLIGAAVLAVLSYCHLMPFESMDAGELCVVETLLVGREDGRIAVFAEDIHGEGMDIQTAIANMEKQAPGQLFLRQTKRIIFCQGTEDVINALDLPDEIPYGAAIYYCEGSPDGLLENLDRLEARLKVKEQDEKVETTVAVLKNTARREAECENQ